MPSSSGALSPEYIAYLNSATWETKRKAALTRAGHACQVCNAGTDLDVHHRTYERFGGGELARDLTVLCRPCHDLFHKHRWVKKGTLPQEKKPSQHRAKKPKKQKRKKKVKQKAGAAPCALCGKIITTKGTCKPCKLKRRRIDQGHCVQCGKDATGAFCTRCRRDKAKRDGIGRGAHTVKDERQSGPLTKKQRQILALQVMEELERRGDASASVRSSKSKANASATKSGSALERPGAQAT